MESPQKLKLRRALMEKLVSLVVGQGGGVDEAVKSMIANEVQTNDTEHSRTGTAM